MELVGIPLAIMIFILRVLNYAIGTVRLVAITRNMRLLAAALAFIEAFVFAVVIAQVVQDLADTLNLMAYCLGASVGSYVGMLLEARLITSFRIVNVVADDQGHDLAVALRESGYGVTETIGEGKNGQVMTLRSVVTSRELPQLLQKLRDINPDAFISIEEARSVRRGWIRSGPGRLPR